MASQILCTQINRSETFPLKIDTTATYNCGIVSVLFDSSYTDSMLKQLPNITLNIYVPLEGTSSLYKYRAITIPTSTKNPQSFVLTDIPQSFTFYIMPMFDDFCCEDCCDCNCHKEPKINTFPIKLVWNDENIMAGGGHSGGSPTPVPVIPPTLTIDMDPDDTQYTEGTIVNVPVPITVTKGSQTIQKIEYRVNNTVVHTITNGVSQGGSFSYTIPNLYQDSNISVVVYAGTSTTTQKSIDIQFLPPYYYGVSDSTTITSLQGLYIATRSGNDKEFTISSDNKYIIIVYESNLPDLTIIKDENGFNYNNSFNHSIITIEGTSYKLYVSETLVTCTNFKYVIS